MGQMKNWAIAIAQLLEDGKTVDEIVSQYDQPWILVDKDGNPIKTINPDLDWLREQVQAVKDNLHNWKLKK